MLKSFEIIAPLVIVIGLGKILCVHGFFEKQDADRMTKMLYWIVLPALLGHTTYKSGSQIAGQTNLFLAVHAAFIIAPLVALALSILVHGKDKRYNAFAAFGAARSNNVYLGLPAVTIAFGAAGQAAGSLYLAVTLVGYNLISIFYGEVVMSGGLSAASVKRSAMHVVQNPLVIACVVGIALAIAKVPLPFVIDSVLSLIGSMANGVALLVLGISLDLPRKLSDLFKTWPDVAMRLLFYPAILWGCFLIWPVERTMFHTAIILSSMPTAVNSFIIAESMGMDADYAREIVSLTTLFAIFSIPLWIMLMGVN